MKRFIMSVFVVFFILIISSPVFSGNLRFGVGASATSSSSTIYFPIKTDSFIIEPMVRYSRGEHDREATSMSQDREYEEVSIGSGFFLYSNVFEKVDLIYGSRIGYMKRNEEYKFVDGSNVSKGESDLSGIYIAPTAGIEYNFNSHISVGCNISIEYQRLTGEEGEIGPVEEKFDLKNIDYTTHTDLFIKYYF